MSAAPPGGLFFLQLSEPRLGAALHFAPRIHPMVEVTRVP
jgi:hypothetical protein